MSPGTRRSLSLGAAAVVAATAVMAGTAIAQDEAPQGGTIVVGEWQAATQLNPYLTNALRDVEGYAPISRGLANINNDGEYVPELLAEFPSIENGGLVVDEDGDGFTLNFVLQEGLAWSDGTPFTLHDFKANYDWAIKVGTEGSVGCVYCSVFAPLIDPAIEGEARWAPENQFIESITVAEDGLTAEVVFRQNYSAWAQALLTQPLIAPALLERCPVRGDRDAGRARLGHPSRDPDERALHRGRGERRRHRLLAERALGRGHGAQPRAAAPPLLRRQGRHVHRLPQR